jgi:hypothetical protein
MKPITHTEKYRHPVDVQCCFCKKTVVRDRYYLKTHPLIYCSEMCRIYYHDPKQFQIMDYTETPQFSYLLGLLATDGHISYPNATKAAKTYMAMIRLKKKDGDQILKDIQNIFGGKIYEETTNGFYKHTSTCWRISNPIFVQYLISIGFTNNKTYTIDIEKWFQSLSEINKKSFIRGCWDGDGCLHISDRSTGKTKSISTHICSASKKFIETIYNYFLTNNKDLTIKKSYK